MIIARERYLDDSSQLHLTLALVTRTGPMHSVLSNVPEAEREAVSDILVTALNEIQRRLQPFVKPGLRPRG